LPFLSFRSGCFWRILAGHLDSEKRGSFDAREKNHQAPADRVRARELADDDGPIFSTVAKLVDAFQRAVPHSRDLELRDEALRLGRELLRSTKYEEGR
jgi:hypothetical protein